MKLVALVPLVLTGCASHTAVIASSANDARASVGSARGHLVAALGDLDAAERAAAEIHGQIGFVSDDESPVWTTVQYASAAVGLVAIAALVYAFRK